MDRFNLDYVEMMLPKLSGVKTALDVGACDVNGSPRGIVEAAGISYLGADLGPGPGVDVTVDITTYWGTVNATFGGKRFDLVMSINTLEHIFEPLKALDAMIGLTKPGGYILVIAPVVWDLHAWPSDYCRLCPDFFTRYAETRKIEIVPGSFLLAARDTRRFSDDLRNLPEEVPQKRLSRPSRILYNRLKRLINPDLKESWPRTSVNVTFRRP